MVQRILVILGHPSSTSFCSALADTYIQSAMPSAVALMNAISTMG